MPIRLRTAMTSEREEVPKHWEACGIGVPWLLGILVGGVGSAGVGVATMVMRQGSALEVVGAILAAVGAVVVATGVACRRWSLSVGEDWLRSEVGPFRRRVPRTAVTHCAGRASTGWRRLFAREEVVVETSRTTDSIPLPTNDPAALCAAILTP